MISAWLAVCIRLLHLVSSTADGQHCGAARASLDKGVMLQYFQNTLLAAKRDGALQADVERAMYGTKSSFERGGRRALLIDIGANVGQITRSMLAYFGGHYEGMNEFEPMHVYAFEPNPMTMKTFVFNINDARSG